MSESQSLIPRAPIADLATLEAKLTALKATTNLVTPLISIDFIPDMFQVSLRAVKLDPDEHGVDVYRDKKFCRNEDDRALTKIGILKIWRAAGGSVLSSRRVDDRADRNYVEWSVMVEIREIDGTRSRFPGSKTIDLRDGSPQAAPMTPAQLGMARSHIGTQAETKAFLRACRSALTLPQKYTVSELAKMFVIPTLVFSPDMTQPDIRRMVAARELSLTDALYGPNRDVDHARGQLVDVTPEGELVNDPAELPPPIKVVEAVEPAHRNDCPCGDRTPMHEDAALNSNEILGCLRIGPCWPSPKMFDRLKHAGIPDLKIPKRPDLTVRRLTELAES